MRQAGAARALNFWYGEILKSLKSGLYFFNPKMQGES